MNRSATARIPTFGPHGPFDTEEQAVIRAVFAAAQDAARPEAPSLLAAVQGRIDLLEQLGAAIDAFPSLLRPQTLGQVTRDLDSLVELVSRSDLSNFDMVLPTKALLGRDLVMAEVNFYRLLRLVCHEGLAEADAARLAPQVDQLLCICLYARLAEDVLKHIASDRTVPDLLRHRAVRALVQIWEHNTYRVQDFFPMLKATWDARRRVPATLGTLMGTSELFGLLCQGADPEFVECLTGAEQTTEVAEAFREFLFGARTEQLRALEAELAASGRAVCGPQELADKGQLADAHASAGDPSMAMFEFFLSRHLQAAARRLTGRPGPKRTAEEYVMLRFLERVDVSRWPGCNGA